MDNYFQYHNSKRMGNSCFNLTFEGGILTSKSTEDIEGNRIWLIGGQGTPRKYYLCYWFIADKITDGITNGFRYRVTGSRGRNFIPPAELTYLGWYRNFQQEVKNFHGGFDKIPHKYLEDFEYFLG